MSKKIDSSHERPVRESSNESVELDADSTDRKHSQHSRRIEYRRSMKSKKPKWALLRAKSKMRDTGLAYVTSRWCMLFLSMMTLASCLFYILATYLENRRWVLYTETAFGIIFLVDYVLSVAASPIPLTYALSSGGLIDLVSCLPAFGAFQPWMSSLAFIRYLRVSKAIRVMRSHQLLSSIFSHDDFTIRTTLLIVKVLSMVLMTSAVLYGVERGFTNNEDGTGAFNEPGWQWHDSFYFTIVTLSTVGYGDILPLSALSRLLMVVVIVFALTYVPLEVGRLVDAVSARPKHRKGFSRSLLGKQIHVVLAMAGGGPGDSANEGEFEFDMLERCVGEFFEDDQTATSRALLWVVVMSPALPTSEIATLCSSPKYHSRVLYYRGDVTNPRDMTAVCAEYADCIFLFPCSRVVGDPRAAEERTHLAAKSIKRYLDRTPIDEGLMKKVKALSQTGMTRRTIVKVEELHSKQQLLGFGIDHVICHDELKMAMFAAATLSPAFLPFVANCVRSCSGEGGLNRKKYKTFEEDDVEDDDIYWARDVSQKKKKSGAAMAGADEDNWLEDYIKGADFEMYSIPLEVLSEDSSLWNMSFKRAARAMYDESDGKVLLIGSVDRPDLAGSDVESPASSSHGGPSASSTDSFSGTRGSRSIATVGRGEAAEAAAATRFGRNNASVKVFPDRNFRFSRDSNLVVLAETQTMAEDLIFNFEGPGEDERFSSVSSNLPRTSSNLESLGHTTKASSSVYPEAPSDAVDVTAGKAPFAPALAPTVIDSISGNKGNGDLTELTPVNADNTAPAAEPQTSAAPKGIGTDQEAADDAHSPSSPAESAASRTRATSGTSAAPSVLAQQLDEEGKGELGKLRKDAFADEEIDWSDAREKLKRARLQLDELDHDAETGAHDSATFFEKVGIVSARITDALRLRTSSVPSDLCEHIVLVGGHSRLQHYVLSLRRQRPMKPLVVITDRQESFFELRDRLVECKFFDRDLNIANIYHIFGRCQDRLTLDEAKVAQAESVVLMADRQNDSSVLLSSFELELVMKDIPFGQKRPKVLIDLSKDSSIYYCGVVLGGERHNPSFSSTRFDDAQDLYGANHDDVRFWPLFASGRVWTSSVMDIFAVRAYFNPHVLSFFETLLQIAPDSQRQEQEQRKEQRQEQEGRQKNQQQRQQQQQQAQSALGSADEDDDDDAEEEEKQTVGGVIGNVIGGIIGSGGGGGGGDRSSVRSSVRFSGVRDTDHNREGSYWSHHATVGGGQSSVGLGGLSIVSGGVSLSGDDPDDSAANPGRCQFGHLRVHSSFAGKTYADLVRYVISRGAIPMGLFRPAGTKGSVLPYTHINPAPNEPLRPWPNAAVVGRPGVGAGEKLFKQRSRRPGIGGNTRGDDVFVVRSRHCSLFGEVSLTQKMSE